VHVCFIARAAGGGDRPARPRPTPQERRSRCPPYGNGQAVFSVTFLSRAGDRARGSSARTICARQYSVCGRAGAQVAAGPVGERCRGRRCAQRRVLRPARAGAVARGHAGGAGGSASQQDTDRGILETPTCSCCRPARLTGEAVEILSRRVQEGAGLNQRAGRPDRGQLVPPGCNPAFQLGSAVFSRRAIRWSCRPGRCCSRPSPLIGPGSGSCAISRPTRCPGAAKRFCFRIPTGRPP